MSRPRRDGPWHDCAAWLPASTVVPYSPPAPGAGWPFFCGHDHGLWRHAGIRETGGTAGPLGHCGLYPRSATQPVRPCGRTPGGGAATIRGRAVTRMTHDPKCHIPAPLAASATPRPAGWAGGRGALRVGLLCAPGAVFPLISYGLYVLAWSGAGLPGHPDAALSGGWSLGRRAAAGT